MPTTRDPSANETGAVPAKAGTAPAARVFVGVTIAPDIGRELARLAEPLEGPSVRRVAPADIHLTLVPPWEERSIPSAIDTLGRVAGGFGTFVLKFAHLGYGPQPRRPRLLWASCTATDEIAGLQAALVAAFGQTNERPFRPHVTLARIRGNGAAIARRHPIDHALSFMQPVDAVVLFQSPSPGERGYRVLASVPLGDPVRSTSRP